MIFINDAHNAFYKQQTAVNKNDCYTKALIYTLGICDDTRQRFESLYDAKDGRIIHDALYASWQTDGSMKVTRLAFQLFTDLMPTAECYHFENNDKEAYCESKRYSISEIFCCEFAPYFVEALKVRYTEYFTVGTN